MDTIDSIIAREGEPDDLIIVDPTRSNEPQGAVLIYDKGGDTNDGYILFDGTKIAKSSITSITFKNTANAYLLNDYAIVIATDDPQQPFLRIYVGTDASWARTVCEQLNMCLTHTEQ